MRSNGVISILITLCLVVQCMGCSWVLMKRAPEDYKQHYNIKCSGYGTPIADTVISSAYLSVSIFGAIKAAGASPYIDPDEECGFDKWCMSPRSSALFVAIIFAIPAIIHGLSALTGYCWSNTCEETKQNHVSWKSNISPAQREDLQLKKQEAKREKLRKRCKRMNRDSKFYFKPDKWAFYLAICRKVEPNTTINSSVIRWVKRLLAKKRSVNESDFHGWTPLHYAAYTGNEKLVKYLLKKGADPSIKDKKGRTPLYYAPRIGSQKIIEMLLNKGADPKLKDKQFKKPLDIAKDVRSSDINCLTKLHLAVKEGNKLKANRLIVLGADINAKDTYGRTPLHYAAQIGLLPPVRERSTPNGLVIHPAGVLGEACALSW